MQYKKHREEITDPAMETLVVHFRALLEILAQEKTALMAYDGHALDACVLHKNELCQNIAQTLQASPEIMAQLSASDAATSSEHNPVSELDADHKLLVELANTARDSNLVNGKILHRSQQYVREILGILSGKSLDGLYGQSGQKTAVPEPGSNAIARA